MDTSLFEAGVLVIFEGSHYKMIRKITATRWQLEECTSMQIIELEQSESERRYLNCTIAFAPHSSLSSAVAAQDEMPGEELEQIKTRRIYVLAILNASASKQIIEPLVANVANLRR